MQRLGKELEQQVVFPEEENARAQQNTEVEISNEYVKKAKIVDGVFPKLIKLHQGWEISVSFARSRFL